MGDTFSGIHNATIINRSILSGSSNRIKDLGGESSADAFLQIAKHVEDSRNKEAGEIFDQFSEEIQKSEPRKSVLRVTWDGLVKALPTVTSVAGAAGAIAKLLS